MVKLKEETVNRLARQYGIPANNVRCYAIHADCENTVELYCGFERMKKTAEAIRSTDNQKVTYRMGSSR